MKKGILLLVFMLLIVLFLLLHIRLFSSPPPVEDSDNGEQTSSTTTVRIHFLDIGQGDATLIEFPTGEQILIDCAIDARVLEALGRVMPVYDKHIDYLFLTHPDKDHYGGCVDVLERFEVGTVVYTGFERDEGFFNRFVEGVYKEQSIYTIIEHEQTWSIASSTLTFLYPDHALKDNPHIPGLEKQEISPNNSSLVLLLQSYGTSVLLTGDAESEQEAYLVERYGKRLDVDIYKAGHHGSSGSSIQPLIDIVTPSDTIFSAGKENSYGHPSPRIMRRVERAGSTVWRTDTNGDILVTINTLGYAISAQYPSSQ